MNSEELKDIEKKVEMVEASGHGEVVIKIQNGRIYRTLHTFDELKTK